MAPENASLMPFYTLTKGQQVRFTALDASTGALVSSVVISKMVIGVDAAPTAAPPIALAFSSAYSQGDQAA